MAGVDEQRFFPFFMSNDSKKMGTRIELSKFLINDCSIKENNIEDKSQIILEII